RRQPPEPAESPRARAYSPCADILLEPVVMLDDDRRMTERHPHHSRVGASLLYLLLAASGQPVQPVSVRELLPAVAAESSAPHVLRPDVPLQRARTAADDAVLLARGQ